MPCLDDHHNYFLLTGLPLAAVGYVSVCFLRVTLWLKLLVGLMLAQVGYALLAANFSETWRLDFDAKMLFTMFGILAFFLLMVVVCTSIVMFFAALVFLSPVVYVNSNWLAALVGAPFWVGVVLFVVCLLALGLCLRLTHLLELIGDVLRVVVSSVLLWIFVRVAVLEHGVWAEGPLEDSQAFPLIQGFERLRLCCSSQGGKRCPVSFDDFRMSLLLCALLAVSAWTTLRSRYCRCNGRRQQQPKKQARPRGALYNRLHTTPSQQLDSPWATGYQTSSPGHA
jgi:hypothetical protein